MADHDATNASEAAEEQGATGTEESQHATAAAGEPAVESTDAPDSGSQAEQTPPEETMDVIEFTAEDPVDNSDADPIPDVFEIVDEPPAQSDAATPDVTEESASTTDPAEDTVESSDDGPAEDSQDLEMGQVDPPVVNEVEIIEPNQPSIPEDDQTAPGEPAVMDLRTDAAGAAERPSGVAPGLGDKVAGIPGLEKVQIHRVPQIQAESEQDGYDSRAAHLDVIGDRVDVGGKVEIDPKFNDPVKLTPARQETDDAVTPLSVEIHPVEAVPEDEPEGTSSAHQSVDTYLASQAAKDRAAAEDTGEETGSVTVQKVRETADQPIFVKAEAVTTTRVIPDEETGEADDSGSSQTAYPIVDSGQVSRVEGVVSESIADALGTSIDTDALRDIDRLTREQIGNASQLDADQLAALIGKVGVAPNANSLVSDEYTRGTTDFMISEAGIAILPHPTKGSVVVTVESSTQNADGTWMVKDYDGTMIVKDHLGAVQWHYPDGDVVWDYGNGNWAIVVPGGVTIAYFADGTQVVTQVNAQGDIISQSTTDANGNTTDTTEQARSGQNQSGGSSGDGNDNDDDDDNDRNNQQDAAEDSGAEASAEDSSGEDAAPPEESTPNPMNEGRGDGTGLFVATEGRMGREQMSTIESGINVAAGSGHTTPVEDTPGGTPLEFLESRLGREQLRTDLQAIDAALGGDDSTPSDHADRVSGAPTVEDLRGLEFIAAGGGLKNPIEEGGTPGVDGGIVGGGGTLNVDDDDPENPEDAGMAQHIAANVQLADNLSADMLTSHISAHVDVSKLAANLDEDLVERIKNSDFEDIS